MFRIEIESKEDMQKVLILDDDQDLLFVLSELCSVLGETECLVASSLDEIKSRKSEIIHCDLAILDVNLGPNQPSGLEVFQWLREINFKGRMVFLTGHANSHPLVQEAKKLHGAQVLAKPVTLESLEHVLKPG